MEARVWLTLARQIRLRRMEVQGTRCHPAGLEPVHRWSRGYRFDSGFYWADHCAWGKDHGSRFQVEAIPS